MQGKVSRASDVYAFGILLWELYTGGHAFKGVPRALLGHEITKGNKRPEFPPDCMFEYQLLACRCWESDYAIRPGFDKVLDDLARMYARLCSEMRGGGEFGLGGPGAGAAAVPQAVARAGGADAGGMSAGAACLLPGARGGAAPPLDSYDSVAGQGPLHVPPRVSEGQQVHNLHPGIRTGHAEGVSADIRQVGSSALQLGPASGTYMWGGEPPLQLGGMAGTGSRSAGSGSATSPNTTTTATTDTGTGHRIAAPPGHAYMAQAYSGGSEEGSIDQSMTDSLLLPPYMRRGGMQAIAEGDNPPLNPNAAQQPPAHGSGTAPG